MVFKIKYDKNSALKGYAYAARTARKSDEDRGEKYEGEIVCNNIDTSLILEEIDWQVARKYVKSAKSELQEAMDRYQKKPYIHVGIERSTPNDGTHVGTKSHGTIEMTIGFVFYQLGIEDRLIEVYRHKKNENGKIEFTGGYKRGGKQKLADILNKEIIFQRRPSSDPILVGRPMKYKPKNN